MENLTKSSGENFTVINSSLLSCLSSQRSVTVGQAVGAMAYCIMIFLSLVGNILVVVIVYRCPTMKTTAYYLMANVAVADVIFFMSAGPRQIIEVFTEPSRWLLTGDAGLLFCQISSFCMDSCQIVSVYSSVAIGINRWLAVLHPKHRKIYAFRTRHLIAGVWVMCMLIFVHYFRSFDLTRRNGSYYCHLSLAPSSLTAYVVTITLLQYVLPLILITVCYIKVISKLNENRFLGSPSSTTATRRKHRNRRVTKMALTITVTFVVLWTPFVIYSYLVVFVWNRTNICPLTDVRFAVMFVAHSYCMINPWIYFSTGGMFRRGLQELWARFNANCTYFATTAASE